MKILIQITILLLTLTSTHSFAGGGSGGGGVRPEVERQLNDFDYRNELNFQDLRKNSNLINLRNKFVLPKNLGHQSSEIYVGEVQNESWQVQVVTLDQSKNNKQAYEEFIQNLQNTQDWNLVTDELLLEVKSNP